MEKRKHLKVVCKRWLAGAGDGMQFDGEGVNTVICMNVCMVQVCMTAARFGRLQMVGMRHEVWLRTSAGRLKGPPSCGSRAQ